MSRWLLITLIGLALLGVLSLGIVGGVVLDRLVLAAFIPLKGIPLDAQSDFELMAQAWNAITTSYVDRPAVQAQKLAYAAISGMVDALGDTGHSRFLDPEMVKQQQAFANGEYEGIGAYVEMKNGQVVIVAPIDGTPAEKAGIRPGDIVIRVDGQDVKGLALDQVVGRILGPVGTQVTISLQDPDSGAVRDVTLTRAKINVKNVAWRQLPGTRFAHLRISAFSTGVTDSLKTALVEVQQQGMSGVILDLRTNPGGLLDEAVGVASQFLKTGNVLLVKNAEGTVTPQAVKEGGVAIELPMVTLVDQGTASAAEIAAAALQDGQRSKLVGETTFGTGTVLTPIGLFDGSELLLATQEWLTPSGRVIWHKGIPPDLQVALAPDGSLLTPEKELDLDATGLLNSGDSQLLTALNLLSGGLEYRRTGGIAGLDDTLTIGADGKAVLERRDGRRELTLEPQQLARLYMQLAGFSQLSAEYLPPDTCCDRFEYTITFEGHTVHTMDGAIPEALRPGIDSLNAMIATEAKP